VLQTKLANPVIQFQTQTLDLQHVLLSKEEKYLLCLWKGRDRKSCRKLISVTSEDRQKAIWEKAKSLNCHGDYTVKISWSIVLKY